MPGVVPGVVPGTSRWIWPWLTGARVGRAVETFQPFLAGEAAIVTGASRGIGRAVALTLARLGADVGLLQRGDAAETSGAVEALGRRAVVVRVDLGDAEAAEVAVHRAADELGRLDVCVANHGVIHREPALDVSARRLPARDRRESHGRIRRHPGCREPLRRGRGGSHRAPRLPALVLRRCQRRRVRREQGSDCAARQVAGERVGLARDPRQRDRAGLDRDGDDEGDPRGACPAN